MARSILADAPFERTTFTAPGTPTVGEDEWGNPIEVPGSPVELVALFAPFKRTQIEFQPGADVSSVEGRGDLLEPLEFPASVRVGSTLSCEYGGKSWSARVTNLIPNDLIGVNFGTYFEVTLSPAGAP